MKSKKTELVERIYEIFMQTLCYVLNVVCLITTHSSNNSVLGYLGHAFVTYHSLNQMTWQPAVKTFPELVDKPFPRLARLADGF